MLGGQRGGWTWLPEGVQACAVGGEHSGARVGGPAPEARIRATIRPTQGAGGAGRGAPLRRGPASPRPQHFCLAGRWARWERLRVPVPGACPQGEDGGPEERFPVLGVRPGHLGVPDPPASQSGPVSPCGFVTRCCPSPARLEPSSASPRTRQSVHSPRGPVCSGGTFGPGLAGSRQRHPQRAV